MTPVLSFIVFTLLWLLPALCALSFTRSVISFVCPWAKSSQTALVGLAPAIGVSFFLVLFSLFGRVIPYYPIATLATLVSMFLLHLFFYRQVPRFQGKVFSVRLIFFAFFVCLHILFWAPRILFSDIHFDPSQYGAEKIFNLSLQQSFTYGTGYPPESLWLAGEREAYYILPRLLPGLATFFSVHFFNAPAQMAGLFFHLSDAFYNALAVLSLGTAAYLLILRTGVTRFSAFLLAALIGVFPFFAAPFRIFTQIFEGHVDFWSLSRIIPFTINEYPFWNYAFADNHAHNNAAFLDVIVWFLTLLLLLRSNEFNRSQKIQFGLLLGVSASALLMAQSGSAFIALVVFALPVALTMLRSVRSGQGWSFAEALVWPAGIALVLSLPDVVSRPHPRVSWHLVPPRLASKFLDFMNVYYSFFIFAFVCFLFIGRPRSSFGQLSASSRFLSAAAFCVVAGTLFGYSALLAVAFFCLVSSLLAADFQKSESWFAHLAIVAIFMLMAFPEFVGINFDMGPDYVRLNTSFKFLYTAFYTVPLSLVFICSLGHRPNISKWRLKFAWLFLGAFLSVHGTAQIVTVLKRISASRPAGGLTGMEFLAMQRPVDDLLIRQLNHLPGRIVVVEACGMPPRSASYTVAGRISAYSGRPSLCGWGMHSFLHREFMQSNLNKGRHVWSFLTEMDKAMNLVFSAPADSHTSSRESLSKAVESLKTQGATHLLFGEFERSLFPTTDVISLANATGGKVIFQIGEHGIVELR